MFCNSTITDLFLFVFTQLILHYHSNLYIHSSYTLNNIYYTMDYKYSFKNIHDHNNYKPYK
ncbi:hypothetical protein CV713_03220 [Streptococcus thermophilus]|nr:hypothetical protein CV714_08645 [Streptococcus thermophilus]PJH82984.1 hypothetical protein CV713_03220 [Streptococcus thermophilus]